MNNMLLNRGGRFGIITGEPPATADGDDIGVWQHPVLGMTQVTVWDGPVYRKSEGNTASALTKEELLEDTWVWEGTYANPPVEMAQQLFSLTADVFLEFGGVNIFVEGAKAGYGYAKNGSGGIDQTPAASTEYNRVKFYAVGDLVGEPTREEPQPSAFIAAHRLSSIDFSSGATYGGTTVTNVPPYRVVSTQTFYDGDSNPPYTFYFIDSGIDYAGSGDTYEMPFVTADPDTYRVYLDWTGRATFLAYYDLWVGPITLYATHLYGRNVVFVGADDPLYSELILDPDHPEWADVIADIIAEEEAKSTAVTEYGIPFGISAYSEEPYDPETPEEWGDAISAEVSNFTSFDRFLSGERNPR